MKITSTIILITLLLASCGTVDSNKKKDDSSSPPQSGNVQPSQPSTPAQPVAPTAPANPASTLVESTDLPNLHNVNANIWRSGYPSANGIAQLKAAGIKTILSLKTYTLDQDDLIAEQNATKANGVKFIHFPLNGILGPSVTELKQALAMLLDTSNYPMLVHCEHGSDRTGMVIATYRITQEKWTFEKAKAEMYQYGHSSLLSWWDDTLKQL